MRNRIPPRPARVWALGIFVKAPIPGRVKTRLAEDIGSSEAADVSRRLGRQVVGATAGSGHRTIVWFTPAREAAFVREWLHGLGPIEFRPQVGATLGARLSHAVTRQFDEGARRVLIIGSDCPGVGRRLIAEAFTALGKYDLVLGPARDGGYYLIGLRAPQPTLFRGISWSTGAVTIETRTRACSLGLSCRLLRPLRDVDTARDARVLGLL